MGVLLPLGVMVAYAFSVGGDSDPTPLLRGENLTRLINTVTLAVGVLCIVTLLAAPMAWLAARSNLALRTTLSVLAVLPLAIPGYVMAYALKGMGGYGGMISAWAGVNINTPTGYWGALLCLSAYNLPYMFLTLRAAMFSVDPSLEEAAFSLGRSRLSVARNVLLPQLLPAFLAGSMLVLLHVIADFGVVSLMRFETLSYDVFLKLESGHSTSRYLASRSGLLLMGLAAVFIAMEMYLLRRVRLDRAGTGNVRRRRIRLSALWQTAGFALFGVVFLVSVITPVTTIVYWAWPADAIGAAGDASFGFESNRSLMYGVWPALWDSIYCSMPAALLATGLAIPIALLRARYPSRRAFVLERLPYIGYATPALVFALSLVLVCLWGMPGPLRGIGSALYQSLSLLVYAYAIHFLAEAVGPIRSGLYLARPRLEEASRSLGHGRWQTFFQITLPLMRHGVIVSLVLVFISCMKELPLTMILSPTGTQTLAMAVWSNTEEVLYDRVAPYALAIMLISSVLVGILLMRGRENN